MFYLWRHLRHGCKNWHDKKSTNLIVDTVVCELTMCCTYACMHAAFSVTCTMRELWVSARMHAVVRTTVNKPLHLMLPIAISLTSKFKLAFPCL